MPEQRDLAASALTALFEEPGVGRCLVAPDGAFFARMPTGCAAGLELIERAATAAGCTAPETRLSNCTWRLSQRSTIMSRSAPAVPRCDALAPLDLVDEEHQQQLVERRALPFSASDALGDR